MLRQKLWRACCLLLVPTLACTLARQTPQPAATVQQLVFEVQTATPTVAPLFGLTSVPTTTPVTAVTPASPLTTTLPLTATALPTPTLAETQEVAPVEEVVVLPTATPVPEPTATPAVPVQGGAWDFEDGFSPWANPHGDRCPGSGLANGWAAFTTRDQYGSSCFNQTTWRGNVYSGESAQEITFAYVGVQAGIFKSVPTIAGHRYTITASMRREFSPVKVEVTLGIDPAGGTDWQAESVQWFPWDEDLDDAWAKTEETVTAAGDSMTIFIKGAHPYPEPGGTLRLDALAIVDIGPE